jgi:thymidine phosphorylase
MKDESVNLMQKLKDDLEKLRESKINLIKELLNKDEELAKKDGVVKELTKKTLDQGESMAKFVNFVDAHNDLKN